MASLFNDEESTDEEFGVNLHLVERLRINRGENSNLMEDRNFDNSKDLKQYCNMRRKLFAQEGQSSSSSSVEIQNDNPSSGLTSSDIYPNKKRQNGDKTTEQLANPKRTCLGGRFHRSSDWRELRKKTRDLEIQPEPPLFPDSYYMQAGNSPDLFPNKKSEENTNSLADAEDSDFEIPIKSNRNIKLENGHSSKSSKHQSAPSSKVIQVPNLESKASTSFFKFFESGSEDESKPIMQNGALKGGRQDPDHNYFTKRLLGRKVNKKLLDTDESDDDNSVSVYRSRPLVYSSSDSEDLTQNAPKSKLNGASSNVSSNHSHSFGDSFDKNAGNRSRQCKSFRSNPKLSKKLFNPVSTNRADSSDGCDRQFLTSDFRKNVTHRACRTRRSPRLNMAAILSSNSITNGNNVNGPVRGRRTTGSERGGRRSGSPHHRNIRCQHKTDETKCSRGRSVSASRAQKEKSNYVAHYPDEFDAEESENEFFTANSYSDTETSTESLGGLTIDTTFPNHAGSISCTINCEERLFEDVSTDDEISVVFSTGPYARNGESRRGSSRTLGRRHSRGTHHRQLQSAREVVSLSPDPVEQVRQVEEDERMARMLQAQFDAEIDPDFVPINRALMELEDSDEDILDPHVDSDSDGQNPLNIPPCPLGLPVNRREFGFNRYSNRTASPTALFLGRRVDTRNRRRYQISREHNHGITRLLHLGIPDMSQFFDGDHYEALLSLDLDDIMPRGLPVSEINRLPTRKYIHPNSAASSSSSEVTHKRTELNKECQVCLTDYENGDILRILPCFHEFHTPCIDPWLSINRTCPVCRVTVDLDA